MSGIRLFTCRVRTGDATSHCIARGKNLRTTQHARYHGMGILRMDCAAGSTRPSCLRQVSSWRIRVIWNSLSLPPACPVCRFNRIMPPCVSSVNGCIFSLINPIANRRNPSSGTKNSRRSPAIATTLTAPHCRKKAKPWLTEPLLKSSFATISEKQIGSYDAKRSP